MRVCLTCRSTEPARKLFVGVRVFAACPLKLTRDQALPLRYVWGIFLGMRVKTSITISEETLRTIDEHSGERVSRSEFIEKAIQAYLSQLIKNARDARDLALINGNAKALNEEAEDVLEYQVNL